MRSFFYSLLGYFLTTPGLVVLAALDSSVVFFLPLGIDFGLVVLTARNPSLFWIYAVLATSGSLVGAALTFWIGHKVGEHGLSKLIPRSRLERVRARVGHSAAISVAALGVIPPPFPFTAFVLASGAGKVNPWTFFGALGIVRLLRFGVEAALAARHGRRILTWMESTVFETIVGVLIVLAVIGTGVSAAAIWRSTRGARHGRRPALAKKSVSP
jgi:membrane protein YqaA with SNARE-associated domain